MTIASARPTSAADSPVEIRIFDELNSTRSSLALRWLRPNVVELLAPFADATILVASGVACAVGYQIYARSAHDHLDVYIALSLFVALNFTLLIKVQHGYSLKNFTNLPRIFKQTLATWTGLFGALIVIIFAMKASSQISRGTIISFYLVGPVLLLLSKAAIARFVKAAVRTGAFAKRRAVAIAELGLASSEEMAELAQHGYRITRLMEIRSEWLSLPSLIPSIAPRLEELIAYARENKIEQIFLMFKWDHRQAIDKVVDALKILPIPINLVPDPNVSRFLRYPLTNVGNTLIAELRRAPLSRAERAVKRTFDLIGATLGLVIFAPVLLVTSIMIKATSKGPVLFRQTRNGFNGRAFKIFKFRTMRVLEDGPIIVQARRNDPRVTPVGRWLRKASIDELPQLFNVLLGDMSLVGPRPHAAAHNSEYEQVISNYAFRQHVKPGITGWAQVNGNRGETLTLDMMNSRVDLDLWYINNWSIWLDARIILRTTVQVTSDPVAY
ncbi:undecaprenyl-phosphate glucose phosphotransferase [Bradyrhizobium sp. LB11.1]|uniref:undecaprenyl-phosphate glucose phosphotransferase n=1 Tax=Bradyrhizobium sp. LB11.1 TaxID=3156326 RepID=UPI003394B640